MKAALRIARKELNDILRERSIVFALLIQFFVAAFSAFLTLGLVGLFDPESVQGFPPSTVAYVGPGGFDEYLRDASNMRIQAYDSLEEALAGFSEGRIHAIVEEGAADPESARTLTLLIPESEFRTTLLISQLKTLMLDYERDLRFERADRIEQTVVYVDARIRPNVFFGFAFSVLLPLLVITPVFLAGAITGDSLSQEIQTRSLHLLRSAPISAADIVIGKLLVPVLLAPGQALLWLLLLRYNGLPVENVLWLLLVALVLALLLSSISALVAFYSRREGQTQAVYTVVILLFFTLGLLLPRDPLNLIARLGVGNADPLSLLTIGFFALGAVTVLGVAIIVAQRRLREDAT